MEREEEMEEEMKEIIMKKLRITKNSKDLPSSSTKMRRKGEKMRENRAKKSLKLFCFTLLKTAPAHLRCAHVLEVCAQDEAAPSRTN